MAITMANDAAFSAEAMPVMRPDRPALVVTSTSWTADEKFDVFLEALRLYEQRARVVNASARARSKGSSLDGTDREDEGEVGGEGGGQRRRPPRLPKLLAIVTGKGDLREKSMAEVIALEEKEKWEWVRCRSVWLSAADYPIMLGGHPSPLSFMLMLTIKFTFTFFNDRFRGPRSLSS